MLKKYGQRIVLSAMVALVSACATTSDDASVDALNSSDAAQTQSLGSDKAFVEQNNSAAAMTNSQSADGLQQCALQVGNQTYYFDFNQSEVKAHDKACLKVQADYLNSHADAKVLLEGHTDPRGSREYNVALGERRADAVVQVLKEAGVSDSQVRTVSYGAEKLASDGHSEADYALDRRVYLDYVEK